MITIPDDTIHSDAAKLIYLSVAMDIFRGPKEVSSANKYITVGLDASRKARQKFLRQAAARPAPRPFGVVFAAGALGSVIGDRYFDDPRSDVIGAGIGVSSALALTIPEKREISKLTSKAKAALIGSIDSQVKAASSTNVRKVVQEMYPGNIQGTPPTLRGKFLNLLGIRSPVDDVASAISRVDLSHAADYLKSTSFDTQLSRLSPLNKGHLMVGSQVKIYNAPDLPSKMQIPHFATPSIKPLTLSSLGLTPASEEVVARTRHFMANDPSMFSPSVPEGFNRVDDLLEMKQAQDAKLIKALNAPITPKIPTSAIATIPKTISNIAMGVGLGEALGSLSLLAGAGVIDAATGSDVYDTTAEAVSSFSNTGSQLLTDVINPNDTKTGAIADAFISPVADFVGGPTIVGAVLSLPKSTSTIWKHFRGQEIDKGNVITNVDDLYDPGTDEHSYATRQILTGGLNDEDHYRPHQLAVFESAASDRSFRDFRGVSPLAYEWDEMKYMADLSHSLSGPTKASTFLTQDESNLILNHYVGSQHDFSTPDFNRDLIQSVRPGEISFQDIGVWEDALANSTTVEESQTVYNDIMDHFGSQYGAALLGDPYATSEASI